MALYKMPFTTIREYTFFYKQHETFIKIDHIKGCKAICYKSQRMKSIEAMITDYSTIKSEISNKKITSNGHIFKTFKTHF